jgi:hypothetical protein
MASTYSNLKFELIGTGEQVGTWGNTTNTNLGTAIEQAIVGTASVSFSSADVTLTLTNTNAAQDARALRLNLTGTSGGARNLILGSGCQIDKPYIINNGLADAVTVKNTAGTGIAVPAGKTMWVYNNGTNVVDAVTHLSSLTLGSALPVASGGTASTTLTANNVILGNGTSAPLFVAPGSNGNVLTSNGTTWTSAAPPASGVSSFSAGTTGFTPNTATTGAVTLGGTLGVSNGGTGQTTYTNGQLLIGNTTGNTLTKATLTASTGISITNGAGSISIAATNNGTVTSVGGTGTVNGVSLSGTVTSSGNLSLSGSVSIAGSQVTSGDIAAARITSALNAGGSAPIYACRAWVNFNGTGVVAIRASGNVSSITDNGTGDYTANFTTVIGDANYSVQHSFGSSGVDVGDNVRVQAIKSMTSSAVRSYQVRAAASTLDWEFMSIAIFR